MEASDDDYFADDGLDNLPPDTLLELEQDAIARAATERAVSNSRNNHAYGTELDLGGDPRQTEELAARIEEASQVL